MLSRRLLAPASVAPHSPLFGAERERERDPLSGNEFPLVSAAGESFSSVLTSVVSLLPPSALSCLFSVSCSLKERERVRLKSQSLEEGKRSRERVERTSTRQKRLERNKERRSRRGRERDWRKSQGNQSQAATCLMAMDVAVVPVLAHTCTHVRTHQKGIRERERERKDGWGCDSLLLSFMSWTTGLLSRHSALASPAAEQSDQRGKYFLFLPSLFP